MRDNNITLEEFFSEDYISALFDERVQSRLARLEHADVSDDVLDDTDSIDSLIANLGQSEYLAEHYKGMSFEQVPDFAH